MITIVPDYYSDFVCKAGDCRHTCCRDWEIDIDAESAVRFRSYGTYMDGKADLTPGMEHFINGPGGNCPFLSRDGLCQMILDKGEESLCEICALHPRFRNFFDDHTETGLGLCCEAVGKLLFSRKEPAHYVDATGGKNSQQAKETEKIVSEITGGMELIPPEDIDWDNWAEFFLSLERMNEAWAVLLEKLRRNPCIPHFSGLYTAEWKERLDRLKEYLAYRHYPDCPDEFMEICWNLCIRLLDITALEKEPEENDLIEISRLFSSEIEYSDENIEKVVAELGY